MSANIFQPGIPAQVAAKQSANNSVISKYEHLEELDPWHEEVDSAPISLEEFQKRRADSVRAETVRKSPKLGAAESRLALAKEPVHKVWLTRRRRDGKVSDHEERTRMQ